MRALRIKRQEDADIFLPPQAFLEAYSLLVEHVYLTRTPRPEAPHKLHRRGATIPVRDYAAYRKLRQVDWRLFKLAREIVEYLDEPK